MKVDRLIWAGTRTAAFDETVQFFSQVLELPVGVSRPHFVRMDLSDGGSVEVFDSASGEYPHFSTGPVPGFEVGNFDGARSELERAKIELLLPEGGERGDYRWQHFRGPDGNVYEIVDYPNRRPSNLARGEMRVTKLIWLGISTPRFAETSRFFTDTMGLHVVEETPGFVECSLPDGSSVEVFRQGGAMDHPNFRTGPVLGFQVEKIGEAIAVLRRRSVPPIMTRLREWGGWAHFRAPDGCIYEVKETRARH